MTLTKSQANLWVITGVVVLVFFLAGFLIGFVPSQTALEQLRAENDQLQRSNSTLQSSLRIAELRGAAAQSLFSKERTMRLKHQSADKA